MVDIKFQTQRQFPFLEDYRKKFPITEGTIFVYIDTIYSNKKEEEWSEFYDIVHHELEHLRHQKEVGAEEWIRKYLTDKDFRLEAELRAYRYQLKIVKEQGGKNEYFEILTECARNISSPLYGSMIKYQKALKLLKE